MKNNLRFRTAKLFVAAGIVTMVATACPPNPGTVPDDTTSTTVTSTVPVTTSTAAPVTTTSTTIAPTTTTSTTTVPATTTTTTIPTPPATNLIPNPGFQLGSGNLITSWSDGSWGTSTRTLTATSDARSGGRAANVTVSGYTDGDAKWAFMPISVTPGGTYTYTDWYKSTTTTSLDVAYIDATGTPTYGGLAQPAATSMWTKTTAVITIPANAVKVAIYHSIFSNGSMQLDDTSLTAGAEKFNRPLVSLQFDDSYKSAAIGQQIVKSFGWNAMQNVVTGEITRSPHDPDYMTAADITSWTSQGGTIGCHTVSHPDLTTKDVPTITSELTNCKNYLTTLTGKPVTQFVTPECASDARVVAIAKTLFESLRNCASPTNFKTGFDAFNLQSINVLSTTTDAELITILAAAKANNGWVIIVYHMVDASSSDAYSVTSATLTRHMQIIKNSGVAVVDSASALHEVQAQIT